MPARIPRRFVGKVAIVTGAAHGMGKRVAMYMAAVGAKVVISDIVTDILEKTGGKCLALTCDVSSRQQVEKIIEELSGKIIDKTLDINVKGVLYAIRAVTPIMKTKK